MTVDTAKRILLETKAMLTVSFLEANWVYLFIGFFAIRAIRRRYFHPLSAFPGPFWASITHWYSVWNYFSWEMHLKEQELHWKYGPVVRYKPDLLLINDHKYLPIVFHKTVDKVEGFQTLKITGFGDATITAITHKEHTRLKRRVAGAYSMTNIKRMEQYIDAHVVSLLRHFNTRFVKTGSPCDFAKWLQYFAYDIVTDVAFGKSIGFMDAGRDLGGFVGSVRDVLPVQSVLVRVRWLARLIEAIPGMSYFMPNPTDEKGMGAVYRFRDELIAGRIKNRSDAKRPDLLHHFLNAKNDDGTYMTFKEICDESLLLMVAGSDTTAMALRILFRHLLTASNSSIFTRLVHEVTTSNLPTNSIPSYDSLQELPYFQAVISEALRLSAVPMFLPRVVSPPGFEINGLHVPGGTTVAMTPWVVARDKTLWGEDAEVFRPDRWLGISGDTRWKYQRFAEFTWGYGSRGCLGKNIALMEINKATVMLLRLFEMRLKEDGEEVPYPHVLKNLSLFMEDGMWVDVKMREGALNEFADLLGTA